MFEQPELILRDRHSDARGWFEVLDDPEVNRDFRERGVIWQQWNVSHSTQGVLRGLHYQEAPYAQAKLIRVVQGVIWDVVVDLRPDSPMYKNWQSFELSGETPQALYIPEGFAHGFLTMSQDATLIYAVSRPRCVDGRWCPISSKRWPRNCSDKIISFGTPAIYI